MIDGAGDESKRRRRARVVAPDDPAVKDWHCPECMKAEGLCWIEVAVTYSGPLTNGKFVSLKGAKKGPYLVCTRCVRMNREGMHGRRGAVALWEPGLGWQFLYVNNR